jgi:multiple sugar transport system permease protein
MNSEKRKNWEVKMNPALFVLKTRRFIIYIIVIFLTLLALIPIYIMLINGTRSTAQINQGISWIPGKDIIKNWAILNAYDMKPHWGLANSTIIACSCTVLSVYFSCMTAYGLHVYRFFGRRLLWTIILIVMMLPSTLSLIGFYQFVAKVRLLDNYIPLIIPSIAAAGTVLFIRQYMSSVLSIELIDAARIDGAGEFRIFNAIILPTIVPVMAAQAIFTFVGAWNNFFTPMILLSTMKKFTMPMQVQMLTSRWYRVELGGVYLGLAITVTPIIVFYAFMSRYIISGLTLGGVKE